jgi:hypothetical protein
MAGLTCNPIVAAAQHFDFWSHPWRLTPKMNENGAVNNKCRKCIAAAPVASRITRLGDALHSG